MALNVQIIYCSNLIMELNPHVHDLISLIWPSYNTNFKFIKVMGKVTEIHGFFFSSFFFYSDVPKSNGQQLGRLGRSVIPI